MVPKEDPIRSYMMERLHRAVLTVRDPFPDDPPDRELFTLSNGAKKVLWLTADGQLHFGEQALAGLTQHVLREIVRNKGFQEWSFSIYSPNRTQPAEQHDDPTAEKQRVLHEIEESMRGIQVTRKLVESWNCSNCACYTTDTLKTPLEQVNKRLCQPCWLKLQQERAAPTQPSRKCSSCNNPLPDSAKPDWNLCTPCTLEGLRKWDDQVVETRKKIAAGEQATPTATVAPNPFYRE